jgi:hypothetical protein
MGMGEVKTTAKTTAAGALIRQRHGGALRNGGTNRGGTGRPANKAKALALKHYTERIPLLGAIADDLDVEPQQRINAIVELRKGAGLIDERGAVTVSDNRQYSAKIVYLPQLGVEVHQIPARIDEDDS